MEASAKQHESGMWARLARMLETIRRDALRNPAIEVPVELPIEEPIAEPPTMLRPAPFQDTRRSSSGLGQMSGFWIL